MELNLGENTGFRVNQSYADNYNKWRRKEELQKYKDRYGEDADDDDSSSSETEDEDAEGLTPQIEQDFLKTLSIIKSKDPKMYQTDAQFYRDQDSDEEEGEPKKSKKSARDEKPMYLKDYERKIMTEHDGQFTDDNDDDENDEDGSRGGRVSPSYVQEQQQIKDSFYSAVHDDSEEEEEEGGMLTMKKKSHEDEEKEEKDYAEWLKRAKKELSTAGAESSEMNALKQFWTDPALDEGERFLRDFILNKGYIDKDPSAMSGFNVEDDDDDDDEHDDDDDDRRGEAEEENFSEEERILEEQEEFERKYNFRYEEPDSEFIKRYPRTVAESVRRKDTRRAEKRVDKKSRHEEVRQKKQEDLKHLKNLKKMEIMERLEKLQEVTGNKTIGIDPDDLEGDFDPAEHDRLMQKMFSEGYDEQEDHMKPQFEEFNEDIGEENWDEWTRGDQETYGQGEDEYNQEEPWQGEGEEEPNFEDPNFNMDADYMDDGDGGDTRASGWNLAQEMVGASRKKRKKMTKFAKALMKKKPVFNPEDKSFEEYVEEYYRLDYEDMVGDLPCRFKYRSVLANDFGLTTEEILKAKEKELNQWASLKKTCQYRTDEEEEQDKVMFQKKARNEMKKKRVFLSLQEESESETEETPMNENSRAASGSNTTPLGSRPMNKTKAQNVRTSQQRDTPETAESSRQEAGTNSSNGKNAQNQGARKRKREKSDKTTNDNDTRETKRKADTNEMKRKDDSLEATQQASERTSEKGDVSHDSKKVPESTVSRTSREKKRERKRMILSKLKEMKKRKQVKRLDGSLSRGLRGGQRMSDARFRAYGLHPVKHRYRMKHEAAKTK